MAKNKDITHARCCEFCEHWEDRDALSGPCKTHGIDTELTEVCDQFKLWDAYETKTKRLEKGAV